MSTQPEYVKQIPCFQGLSEEHLNAIAEISNGVCYPPDHVLFREGEKANYLFFIVTGKVEVLYNLGEEGEVKVDTIGADEIAGCSALVEPFTYAATERSLTDIEVLEINIQSLREMISHDCQMGLKMYEHIIMVLMKRIVELRMETL